MVSVSRLWKVTLRVKGMLPWMTSLGGWLEAMDGGTEGGGREV